MHYFLLLLAVMLAGTVAHAEGGKRLGVFGTVTAIDPLIVAGQQIVVPDGLRIISPLGAGQTLGIGDTLAVAVSLDEGVMTATRILEIYPLVGPVASVSGTSAVIMGTELHLPPETKLEVGRWVAVSGLWSGDTVITTRLRPFDGGGFGQLTGVIKAETMEVGSSAVRGGHIPVEGYGEGIWMFTGTPRDDGLQVDLTSRGLFGGDVDMMLWQGYASAPVASQTYAIHGTGITGSAPDDLMPAPGTLVRRCAQKGRILRAPPEGLDIAFSALGCLQEAQGE